MAAQNGNYVSPTDTQGGGQGGWASTDSSATLNGDGLVNTTDLGPLSSTFNASTVNPFYQAYVDADNDGVVDQIDLGQFRSRFNANVFAATVPGVTPDSGPVPAPSTVVAPAPAPSPSPSPIVAPKPAAAPVLSVVYNGGNGERSEVRTISGASLPRSR